MSIHIKEWINKYRYYIIIVLTYFLSQGLLLIVSGRWWDDWCFFNISHAGMWQWSKEMGRPSLFILCELFKYIPNWVYRWVTFFSYLACAFLYFKIMCNVLKIDEITALIATLFFITLPINDVRICFAVFSYSLAILAFLSGFWLFFRMQTSEKEPTRHRIGSIILFLLSFCLMNSSIFMYPLIFLYVICDERRINGLFRYVDFILLPIVFTIVKFIAFPTCGIYANYNRVTIDGFLFSFTHVFEIDLNTFKLIIESLLETLFDKRVLELTILFIAFSFSILCEKKRTLMLKEEKYREIKLLTIGIILLSLSVIPYAMIRMRSFIAVKYLQGRDSIMVSLGVPLVLLAIINFFLSGKGRVFLTILIVLTSIVCTNNRYLEYQREYYRLSGFQNEIQKSEFIKKNHTFVVEIKPSTEVGGRCFYEYNGLAEEIYDTENRLFLAGVGDAEKYLKGWDNQYIEREWYNMREYTNTGVIDGIIRYSNDFNWKDILKLKCLEVFDRKAFNRELMKQSEFRLIQRGEREYWDFIRNLE